MTSIGKPVAKLWPFLSKIAASRHLGFLKLAKKNEVESIDISRKQQ